MDGDLLTGAVGAGGGVVAVWTLVRGLGRWIEARGDKGKAEAATEAVNAKAVAKVLGMVTDLEERVKILEGQVREEREKRTAAEKLVGVLEERCKALALRCDEAEAMAVRWEKRAEVVHKELQAWHEAGRPSTLSLRPLPTGKKR